MGKMALGYGSEWHLLRFLGRHRHMLNRAIEAVVGGRVVDWLDFRFNPAREFYDEEVTGLDFLGPDHQLLREWRDWWPQSGNVHNWDAVGKVMLNGREEWLLVEAKANERELKSSCGAKENGGFSAIRKALIETQKAMNISVPVECWLSPYYQYANRLAVLHFLNSHHQSARLVHIYFCGDTNPAGICPNSDEEWGPALECMYQRLDFSKKSELADRVHVVFLPVCTV